MAQNTDGCIQSCIYLKICMPRETPTRKTQPNDSGLNISKVGIAKKCGFILMQEEGGRGERENEISNLAYLLG